MLDVRRLPKALISATFALSGVVATTGAASIALGVGSGAEVPCPEVDAAKPAGDILDCLSASTAFIETPIGSGSGLVLPGGHVLTNAHVVDPFDRVDLTVAGEKVEDVPVIGVDLLRDIAVLGPVETDAEPVTIIDPEDIQKGDELFLVGYPGEANDEDLEATVADGILSRTRTSEQFGLTYLQTDASIGGGQSGGALVDIDGNVVGISSLRFADNFALALSGKDANVAVDQILGGQSDEYTIWPGGDPVTSATLPLENAENVELITFPADPADRTVDVTVPADQPLFLFTTTVESDEDLQVAANFLALGAEDQGVPYSTFAGLSAAQITELEEMAIEEFGEVDVADLAERIGPGQFRFEIPADEHLLLGVLTNRESGAQVPISASIGFGHIQQQAPEAIDLGFETIGTVTSTAPYDTFTIELDEGQEVHLNAASPSGDMGIYVFGPKDADEELEEYDDSRAGLFGLDVDEVFEAPESGTYRLEVGSMDGAATAYRFTISDD